MEREDYIYQQKTNETYIQFEEIVIEIFKRSGYKIAKGQMISDKLFCDFIASMNGDVYYVETKFITNTVNVLQNQSLTRLQILAEEIKSRGTVLLVVAGVVTETAKNKYQCDSNIIILDLPNLLWAVSGDSDIRNKLVSILPYSVDDIECVEPSIKLSWIYHTDEPRSLLNQLLRCKKGKEGAQEFERICVDLLKLIFVDDLSLWQSQKKSNMDLYRFDLLCRIKIGNQGAFWHIIEYSFKSNYIVFEFKNYSDKITQKEIYTTEKYLYAKALRTVAIMITTHGADKNAKWAAKGCLRENGKLIMVLDVSDVEKMLEMKKEGEDPSNHLLSVLDEMLSDLEK